MRLTWWPINRADDVHVAFIRAALAFGLVGGLTLAVTLPVLAALGRMDVSWIAHAQVHGHIQVVGFAGLFIVGVAFKLAPRFGRGDLAFPHLVLPCWWSLVSALLLRATGQPLAGEPTFAALMVLGAVLELLGASLFLAIIAATLRPALRQFTPHALLMSAAACWFVAQALLGLWWLAELAGDGHIVLAGTRNGVLLPLQMYGFLLGMFLGVGFRSFPSFFGMPQPSPRLGLAAVVLLQAGLVAVLVAGLGPEWSIDLTWLVSVGHGLVGAGVLTAVSAFGWWRREMRLAAASQPLAWALRATLIWLTVTGLVLVVTSLDAAAAGKVISASTSDATRHILGIGVITLGITTMAQLILPEFASERLVRTTSRWRGSGLALALSLAVMLRAILPLMGVPPWLHFWVIATGGIITLLAVAAFAVLIARAWRSHHAYMRRIAAYRQREVPVVE